MGLWADYVGGGNTFEQSMANTFEGTNYVGGENMAGGPGFAITGSNDFNDSQASVDRLANAYKTNNDNNSGSTTTNNNDNNNNDKNHHNDNNNNNNNNKNVYKNFQIITYIYLTYYSKLLLTDKTNY